MNKEQECKIVPFKAPTLKELWIRRRCKVCGEEFMSFDGEELCPKCILKKMSKHGKPT